MAAAAPTVEPVAPDELAGAVPEAVGLREHRPMREVALDVVGQRVHRGVALVRILLEALEDDRVEIAAHGAAQFAEGRDRSAAPAPR